MKLSLPQSYIVTSTQQILLFLAGVGSGKTFITGIKSGYFITTFPEVFGFIAANTYMQLSQSTLLRVRAVWDELYGLKVDEHYVIDKIPPHGFARSKMQFKSYNGIISFWNGAVVFVGSMENAKAHDGKEFGWAFLDETKDTRETDVKETILSRLRMQGMYIDTNGQLTKEKTGNEPFLPLYITTSPAKVDWINNWFELDSFQNEIRSLIFDKNKFFKKEFKDKCVVISSTYHNEANLPKGYISKLMNNYSKNLAEMLIYGNPYVSNGGEFYAMFNRFKHTKEVVYDKTLPIHISFDQNVVPYCTATLYQVYIGDNDMIICRAFDEICLANPRNTTEHVCLEFIRRYPPNNVSGLFYYGDPSGRKRDTRGHENDYDIIRRTLREYINNKSDRVPYSHPPVLKRKDFINNAFAGRYNVAIEIGLKCSNLIADFEHIKEDKNGKKQKKVTKDPETGISSEKYGHTSDSFDYFFVEVNRPLFLRLMK